MALCMETISSPVAAVLEELFDEDYSVSSKVRKTGRFDFQTIVSISEPRRILKIVSLPSRLVGRVIIDSYRNGHFSVSQSAIVSWGDTHFMREYSDKVYGVLREKNVTLDGVSSLR